MSYCVHMNHVIIYYVQSNAKLTNETRQVFLQLYMKLCATCTKANNKITPVIMQANYSKYTSILHTSVSIVSGYRRP